MKSFINVEFLDTNILVYSASGIPEDRRKTQIARSLTSRSEIAISLQVLQEFYNVARHPRKLAFSHDEAAAYCQYWRRFKVLEPTLDLFDEAIATCERHQITFYDAAIIAAAHRLHCPIVYSEDLNHGQNYGGVKVLNSFLG